MLPLQMQAAPYPEAQQAKDSEQAHGPMYGKIRQVLPFKPMPTHQEPQLLQA
jgi:hypothetical protein